MPLFLPSVLCIYVYLFEDGTKYHKLFNVHVFNSCGKGYPCMQIYYRAIQSSAPASTQVLGPSMTLPFYVKLISCLLLI